MKAPFRRACSVLILAATVASPATAHMFIIKPFTGESFMRLFSTHPSTEDRIARLQAMR